MVHSFGGDILDAIDKINALLKQRGLSGAELSRAIGVSTAVYSQWNTKKTKPSNKNLAKVAAVLGVSVSELTGEPKKEKPTPVSGDELSNGEAKLLALFRQVPEESQQMVIGMIEGALKNLGLLE